MQDITKPDMNNLKDVIAGKTRVTMKTEKLRGKTIVRGGRGTAIRTMGLLGGIFSCAVEAGVIENNPTPGLRKPKYPVRDRRLTYCGTALWALRTIWVSPRSRSQH